MATGNAAPESERKKYNRQIWRGGIAFLVLLIALPFTILHSGLQAVQPYFGFGMALITTILGGYLLHVSRRDAQLAQRGIRVERESLIERFSERLSVFASTAATNMIQGMLKGIVAGLANVLAKHIHHRETSDHHRDH